VQKNWDNSRSDPQLSLAKEGTLLGSCSVLLLEKELAASSDGAGSLGGNKTTLLTAGSVSSGGRGVTDVLMVTTTVRMLDGVHGNTSDSGPVSLLGVGSVVGAVGTEHGLVSTLTAGDNTDHSSAATDDGLADAGGESDTGLLTILGVADDDGGGARGTGEASTVTEFGLNVGDDGTLGHGVNGKDVADRQGSY